MFNDTDDGQTQYCPMCEEWAEKYEKLKVENDGLKSQLDFEIQKRETVEAENEGLNRLTGIYSFRQMKKYKQALEEVREIINFRFKTPYMKLGLKETDKIIEDIEKIINEVLKSENH